MPEVKLCSIDKCGKPVVGRGWCRKHYSRWHRNGSPEAITKAPPGSGIKWLHEVALTYKEDDCLTWPYYTDKYGRSIVHSDGKLHYGSRLVCELVHGDPPSPAHIAAHNCGNGHLACVNPKHIRWATKQENSDDMIAHGTRQRGEATPAAKLTANQVREIRTLASSMTQMDLAARYGVGREAISKIVTGRRWAWLE
jgi:hypothetical protein